MDSRRSLAVDAGLAVTLSAASCVAGYAYHPAGWSRFDTAAYVLTCLVSLPLAARRRFPVPALLASNAAYVAYVALGYQPSINWWGPVIALFFVAAARAGHTVLACWAVTAAAILVTGLEAPLPVELAVAQAVAIPPLAVAVGVGTRRLAERNRLLAELTVRLRAEQRERARQAVVAERVRIARELHDVVAHHMSVVAIQAGVARYVLTSDPGTADAALATVADASREALAEMRRMLALLRVDVDGEGPDPRNAPARDPAPGLDQLDTLVERVRAAGLPVEVVVTGERRPLNPGADLCAYRVVQEGLTNVLKHAGPARATVTLAYGDGGLSIRVADDGSRPPRRTGERVGMGLSGMEERARVYGGTLAAGPRPEGGFEVVLTLPAAAFANQSIVDARG